MNFMAQWRQASTKREPPKTKAELLLMLAEAVRNKVPVTSRSRTRVGRDKPVLELQPFLTLPEAIRSLGAPGNLSGQSELQYFAEV